MECVYLSSLCFLLHRTDPSHEFRQETEKIDRRMWVTGDVINNMFTGTEARSFMFAV